MAQPTQPYKRSLAGSLGAGMGSLFGGSGKRFYVLEHKVSSKYHKAGDTQEIIVDQIEMGRDPKCQIRFDESFTTVSRRHAAIVKDGDNWKLVQLSQSNSTLLNGKRVQKEWYLQNGDEIQLSVNGPKLGFIIPPGNAGKVGSIALSRRFSLFRQQALRPYKQALTALSVILALAIGGFTSVLFIQADKFEKSTAENSAHIASLISAQSDLTQELAEEQRRNDSINAVLRDIRNRPTGNGQTPSGVMSRMIEKCKDDIYFIMVSKVVLTDGQHEETVMYGGEDEEQKPYGWTGTGFLLDDGRFVTARHCIEFWHFETDMSVLSAYAQAYSLPGLQIVAYMDAISRTGKRFQFKNSDFTCVDSYDGVRELGTFEDGTPARIASVLFATDESVWSSDWAYVKTNDHGHLAFDSQLSSHLPSATDLHVLGFPGNMGVMDTPSNINPVYNKFSVSMDGLDNGGCIVHSRGTDHGNSGGPIFAMSNNDLVVVGIVSRGSSKSAEYNHAVPISALR